MRPSRARRWFWWSASLVALFPCLMAAAEPGPRTWRPMADWYPRTLLIPNLTARSVEHTELRFHAGDDTRWAAPDWNDADWPILERSRLPLQAGIAWVRLRVRTRGADERIPALVLISGIPAFDFFWDGVLLRSTGTPGNDAGSQRSGTNVTTFELNPGATTPGEHVIALRISTYGPARLGAKFAGLGLFTLPPDDFRTLDARVRLQPAMAVGAMVTLGLAAFLFWLLADRKRMLALFAALCLSAAALVAVAGAPHMWVYPAEWIFFQSVLRLGLAGLVGSLLIATTLVLLHPAARLAWLTLPFACEIAVAIGCAPQGLAGSAWQWRITFVALLAVAAHAAWLRRDRTWLILAGAAVTWAAFEADPVHFDHSGFLPAFLPLLGCVIGAIALRVRRERLAARDAALTAARLEIDLLRKSLQPHFMMNTLTALAQVIDENPTAAVRLIDDLALEFRALARFSAQKQVSVADELALCRAHLGVMSARTDRTWRLDAEGVDVTAAIPPALFLTLIENGFTHQRAPAGSTLFTLRAARTARGIRYTFVSPGSGASGPSRPGGGTGLRYIRARLEESFQDGWKMSQGAVAGGWETIIEFPVFAPDGAPA